MFDINSMILTALIPGLVITVVILVVTVGIIFFVFRKVGAMAAPNRQLLATGESAQATIVYLWDTGTTVNDNPLVGLLLQVQPAGRPAYQVQTTHLISRLQIPQFQPGRMLAVKIDPQNPQKVAIAGFLGTPGVQGMPTSS